jgi:hypothetical protein
MTYLSLYGVEIYFVITCLVFLIGAKALLHARVSGSVLYIVELIVLLVSMSVVAYDIAERPYGIEGDTAVYIDFFNDISMGRDNPFSTFDVGFVGVVKAFCMLELPYNALFFMITFLFLGSYYLLAVAMLGRRSCLPLIVFALLLFYPFFYSLTANIIRQGFSLCFINFALIAGVNDQRRKMMFSSVLATLFHKSSIIFLPFFLFKKYIQKMNVLTLVVVWLVVTSASYLKLFSFLAASLFDVLSGYGLVVNYTDADNIDYAIGFRWDFWLFSSLSIFFMLCLKFLGLLRKDEVYIFYVCAFLACVHIAMFDVAYNDRFGIYSWIFYPLEVIYILRAVLLNLAENKRDDAVERQITSS